jgi:hypothetical protein
MDDIRYPEYHNCKHGEKNIITKDVFCNRHLEFCKFVNCNFKQEDKQ